MLQMFKRSVFGGEEGQEDEHGLAGKHGKSHGTHRGRGQGTSVDSTESLDSSLFTEDGFKDIELDSIENKIKMLKAIKNEQKTPKFKGPDEMGRSASDVQGLQLIREGSSASRISREPSDVSRSPSGLAKEDSPDPCPVTAIKPPRRSRGSADGNKPTNKANAFEFVSIMFLDIKGYQKKMKILTPKELQEWLRAVHAEIEKIMAVHHVQKIETRMDSCIFSAGTRTIPTDKQSTQMTRLKDFAIELKTKFDQDDHGGVSFGVATGPLAIAIKHGTQEETIMACGDIVNTAARMVQTGESGWIHMTKESAQKFCHETQCLLPKLDAIQVKSKGLMQTAWYDPVADQFGIPSSRSSGAKEETKHESLKLGSKLVKSK